jgi:hypothetical protein
MNVSPPSFCNEKSISGVKPNCINPSAVIMLDPYQFEAREKRGSRGKLPTGS